MPIYEYACNECGHALEALQKMSEAPLTDCPACARPALKKKISAAGFRLTGSGWYETDFKQKPKDKAESGDAADKKGKDGGDKPTESKPTESKSAESKSAESKSAESKSAESKSAGGAGAAKEAAV